MKSDERAKKIEKAMKLVWSSLESHLAWTYGERKQGKGLGTKAFDKKCVKEYSILLKLISELYD